MLACVGACSVSALRGDASARKVSRLAKQKLATQFASLACASLALALPLPATNDSINLWNTVLNFDTEWLTLVSRRGRPRAQRYAHV